MLSFFSSFLAAGILLALVFGYLSFTQTVPARGGDLKIGLIGSPRYVNPIINQTNNTDQDLSALVYSSLMKYDTGGNLAKDLADDYKIGDSGKIYEVFIRKNVKWHDGQNLTIDDVIFTLKLIQDTEYKSQLRSTWQGVEIEKIDDYSIRFKIKNAYAPFLQNLTFGVLPKHLWENVVPSSFPLHEMNLKPVGSGPYKFQKLKKDKNGIIKSMEFKSFEEYFDGKAYIGNLVFNFYPSEDAAIAAWKEKEIESLSSISPANTNLFRDDKNRANTYSLPLPRYFAVFFNQSQNKILGDKNVRLALNQGTNKSGLIGEVINNEGRIADTPILPGMTGYSSSAKKYDFNFDEAKKILENAGWKDADGDGIREKDKQILEITLTTFDWQELTRSAQILQKQWSDLGFKVNLDIKEMSKIQTEVIKPRQYQALLFGEILNLEPDPYSFWHSSQKKDPGLNLALYESRDADKLLEEGRQDLDLNSRSQKYQQLCSIINEDIPAIFLFSPNYIMALDKKVKGEQANTINTPSGRFNQISQWYINTQREWNFLKK